MRQRGNDSGSCGSTPAGIRSVAGSYVERAFRGTKREASKALAALIVEAERLAPKSAKKANRRSPHERMACARHRVSPRTVTTCRVYIDNPIVPAIGSIPAAKLMTTDLDRFYRQLLRFGAGHGPYAPATIRRVHDIIRRALGQGVRWGWISHNPAIDAWPPRVPAKEPTPPSPDELVRLFRVAEQSDPALATPLLLAARSGARRDELIALRWKDPDLDRGPLRIERGIVLRRWRVHRAGAKNHQSRRLTLDPTTTAALNEHKHRVEENVRAAGTEVTSESFVFSFEAERLVALASGLHHAWVSTALPVSGIERRPSPRPPALRRHPPPVVGRRRAHGRLGHRNPTTTLNVYAHFVPGADRDAAAALGRVFDDALRVTGSRRSGDAPPDRGV